jgi:hypothetical protein
VEYVPEGHDVHVAALWAATAAE